MNTREVLEENHTSFKSKYSNLDEGWSPKQMVGERSLGFLEELSGELNLILYTIADAVYSAKTNTDYSDRFDDVLWLTEKEKVSAPCHSLQYFCELIGIEFRKIQNLILNVLVDRSLFNSDIRTRVTYRAKV